VDGVIIHNGKVAVESLPEGVRYRVTCKVSSIRIEREDGTEPIEMGHVPTGKGQVLSRQRGVEYVVLEALPPSSVHTLIRHGASVHIYQIGTTEKSQAGPAMSWGERMAHLFWPGSGGKGRG